MTWMIVMGEKRHARPCAGHPRLSYLRTAKTWMARTRPAMTTVEGAPPRSPPLVGYLQLGGRRLRRPHGDVLVALQLDQIGCGESVLAGVVELDALVAHHQLIGLEVGNF